MKRKITVEESDDFDYNEDDTYIPPRGEAFSMGLISGWESMMKALPWIIIGLVILIGFICSK